MLPTTMLVKTLALTIGLRALWLLTTVMIILLMVLLLKCTLALGTSVKMKQTTNLHSVVLFQLRVLFYSSYLIKLW